MNPGVSRSSLPQDTAQFLDLLRPGARQPEAVRSLFEQGSDLIVTRAPGRLDVMGGIADYSGSLVLQWPIREATHVAMALDSEPRLRIVSLLDGHVRECDVPLDVLARDGNARSYAEVRDWFDADASRHWAAYVAGAWVVLARERGLPITAGARVLVHSDVPEGKGVSSSAALEASSMRALAESSGIRLEVRDTALLCQRVENLVVGAPCGVMDQMAVVGAEAGRFMALLCQPAEYRGTVALPAGLALWGIDSGIRHAVTGSDYASVRIGAFMGYRVLADLAGLPVHQGETTGHVRIDDERWGGYLVNVGVATFAEMESRIPDEITGADFLARYAGTTDPVTVVDPARTYAVRIPTRHPVHEHARVAAWHHLLGGLECTVSAASAVPAEQLGQFMYESHASYSACGLGSSGTDRLVELAREAGPGRGVYGAKITGGGSGGTVALLTAEGAEPVVRSIAARYARESGREVRIFSGSSPGSASFGALRVRIT